MHFRRYSVISSPGVYSSCKRSRPTNIDDTDKVPSPFLSIDAATGFNLTRLLQRQDEWTYRFIRLGNNDHEGVLFNGQYQLSVSPYRFTRQVSSQEMTIKDREGFLRRENELDLSKLVIS